MSPREAVAIAHKVTVDLQLKRPLTEREVLCVADPEYDSFLPPLNAYDEELWAPIESRIFQEAEATA